LDAVKVNLCKRCAAIDFDALLSRQHKKSEGQFAKGLGPVAR
jgi:hypothetical protein